MKYAVKTSTERKLELAPRLLSYIRHLPAFDWEPVNLNGRLRIEFIVILTTISQIDLC